MASARSPIRVAWLALALLGACGRRGPHDTRTGWAGPTAEDTAPATDSANDGWRDDSDGQDWPGYGRSWGEQHYSPLAEIDPGTIGGLGLAWSADLPVGNVVTQPIEVGGTLYLSTGYSVVRALDATTGEELWSFDPHATQAAGMKLRAGWGSRGLAYADGTIFVGTQDGRLIAIDAQSGRPRWSKTTIDRDDNRYVDGAPRVLDGMVVIGASIAGVGRARGYVTAYDSDTGRQVWRFTSVPGDPSAASADDATAPLASSWRGQWWQWGGGGAISNAMAFDPESDTLFVGTGPGTPWNHAIRSDGQGDDLLISSIVALDARTGRPKWHYQMVPGDSWGFGSTDDIELADFILAGKPRQVLIAPGRDGFVYVIDRTDGMLISARPFVPTSWASRVDPQNGRPVEADGARYLQSPATLAPTALGAHGPLPMAVSPEAGLAFIPFTDLQATYDAGGMTPANWQPNGGFALDHGVRVGFSPDPKSKAASGLIAWNPAVGKPLWRIATPSPVAGGVLATGGGVVFQGRIDGMFAAYRTLTGRRLWSFAAGAPVVAPPISYAVNGRQYVTVVTGFTGPMARLGAMLAPWDLRYRTQARRVLTFVIGGRAALPAHPVDPPRLLADPNYAADPALAAAGHAIYAQRCATCHGIDAIAAGAAPDLRRSATLLSYEEFDSILRDGMLEANGMPRYGELKSPDRAALRQYLRARADDLRNGR